MSETYINFKNQKTLNVFLKLFLIVMLCVLFSSLISHNAYAADLCTNEQNGNPTPDFSVTNSTLISNIVMDIKSKLSRVSFMMYQGITQPLVGGLSAAGYLGAVQALAIMSIVIYGILFMTGMIQLKFYDFVVRVIKIGIIATLVSPTSWFFFSDVVVKFFENGTDEIIALVTGAGTTSIFGFNNPANGLATFSVIDSAVSKIISAKMFVTILATFLTTPYGPIIGIMLVMAIWSFLKSLMTAMWVYIMALVLRTLLFGLAPIFIPTILFQRTRHIFDGWVNQLVSSSLQPILLFIFFVFFVRLMEGSMDTVMQTPICFSKFPEGWRGSSFDFSYWRFMEYTGPGTGWQPTTKAWKLSDPFPLDMLAVLTFFIIAEMANRFNYVIIQIAAQISRASTSLSNVQGPFSALQRSAHTFSARSRAGNPISPGALK